MITFFSVIFTQRNVKPIRTIMNKLNGYFSENHGKDEYTIISDAVSDIVEKVRIENACELLKKSKLSIENIAKMCGYNSSTSFRRAFKRYTNLSPSEYAANSSSIGEIYQDTCNSFQDTIKFTEEVKK